MIVYSNHGVHHKKKNGEVNNMLVDQIFTVAPPHPQSGYYG